MDHRKKSVFADCERSLSSIDLRRLDALRDGALLLTGATGFVGTWLLTLLAYLNDRHGFAIRTTAISRHPGKMADRAAFLNGREDIGFVKSDVRQLVDIDPATRWIVHAAGNPDARHHATNPIDTAAVIGEGTLHLLRTADHLSELRAFLHLSSGLVADGAGHDHGPSETYVAAKTYSEALCTAFRAQARLPVVISRPYTFIGPFQPIDAPWAVNGFLRAAMGGQPIKILGNGDVLRSYLYGSDMAVLLLLQLAGGQVGATYDLGGTTPTTLRDLAGAVIRQIRRPIEIRYNTGGRPPSERALLPVETGFEFVPAFDVDAAIARTLQWHEAGAPVV